MSTATSEISVDLLRPADLDDADRVVRRAFGTFLGLPDPASFMGDAGYVHSRYAADPAAAFAARRAGELVGSNFATNWGSVGFFRPLSVHPAHWDSGVGSRLMEPVLELFDAWRLTHSGLFTFAQSEKHVGLYQKFGYWPRYLTAIMAKPVHPSGRVPGLYSTHTDRDAVLAGCRELTGSVYDGLDVSREITAVHEQQLGDTVLLLDDAGVAGLAVCHCGPGTEAGSGTCFVKVGLVRSGNGADARFAALLTACDAFAAARGLPTITAGVNLGRHEAYRAMLDRGYRTALQGVAMERDNVTAYNRPGVYLIDDWR